MTDPETDISREKVLCTLALLQGIAIEDVGNTVKKSPLINSITDILILMRALDYVFERNLDYRRHVYILDDATIPKLSGDGRLQMATAELSRHLEVMGTLGLIYRFNVAPKFGISDSGKMQLRLNGWGRIVFDALECGRLPQFDETISHLSEVVESHRVEYTELLSLCNSEQRPLNTLRIYELISSVPVTVVT